MTSDSAVLEPQSTAARFDPVPAARTRLSKLSGMRGVFGVIRMWPDQAVAEHENIARLRDAARLLGLRLIELDKFGHILGAPRTRVTDDDVDFVLHLHFETGKTYDATSVAAMWNPTQFYFDWGFERHWNNQISHDLFAYTGAPEIRKLIRASRGDAVAEDMPLLNHTLAEPIIPPRKHSSYRVFYCGINWEKLTNKPERHGAVLRELDALGLIDIYGPESIKGVKVWEGYKGFKGPLPFDGQTTIRKVAESGACLVFSSDAHIRSGIMSNRMFEALAAGAVVIGDEHPFIETALGEHYVRVPSTLPAHERVALIASALRRFDRDPDDAVALAAAAQQRFLERYHLCDQLAGLYEAVDRFRRRTESGLAAITEPVVDLVIQPVDAEASRIRGRVDELAKGLRGKARITLIVDRDQEQWYETTFGSVANVVALPGRQVRILTPHECLALAGDRLQCPKVVFLLGIEEIMPEALLSACRDTAGHPVALLGHVLKHHDEQQAVHYDFCRGAADLLQLHEAAVGCVIFEREWLVDDIAMHGMGWRDLCRAAAAETGSLVDCPRTGLVVDIKAYERIPVAVRDEVIRRLDTSTLTRASAGGIRPLSADAVVVPVRSRSEPVRELSKTNLLDTVAAMDMESRWRLTLALYKSVPLPRWLRSTITFCRWCVGIR